MQFLITYLPILLAIFLIAKEAWQTWKDGLFLSLIKLGITIVSLGLSFGLTRLLINPARVDLFGLGQLLYDKIPVDFFIVMPQMEAFIKALPTALLAIIGFTVIFDLIRINGCKLMRKLNAKHHWSERFLKIRYEKAATLAVGALCSALCLMTDLVILCGSLTFSGNMLYCAKTATGQELFASAGDVVHQLEKSPLIRLANSLGAQDVFFKLTEGQRDGETFSVGQELIRVSDSFVGMLPVFDVLPRDGEVPSPGQIRALPEALGSSEDSLALLVGTVRSYREDLGDSDAVMILSSLMGTTPEKFEQYLSQLTVEDSKKDLETFCEVAALLADRDLIPEEGENFDLEALKDPVLLKEVKDQLDKNKHLTTYFGT